MAEAVDDEPASITMGMARAHYTDMGLEEREAMFWQAQADQRYNLCLLDEHLHVEEQLVDTSIMSDVDVDEEALLLSPTARPTTSAASDSSTVSCRQKKKPPLRRSMVVTKFY